MKDQSQEELFANRPVVMEDDTRSRGDVRDCCPIHNDVDHNGDKSMLLNVKRPGVQGERVAERGNTISWENPFQKPAHGQSYYLDEKDTDNDIGN